MLPTQLLEKYNKLQNQYGDPSLDSITSGGQFQNPDICFVFMNPTGRNVAANKEWKDIKSPWIGTKNVWDMFFQLDMLDREVYTEIKRRKPLNRRIKYS